jgi:hypothetical protein
MREAGSMARPAAGADREIDPRVVEHPLGVIIFDDGRLGRKEGRVEPDRLSQVVNRHVHMQALHHFLLW